MNGGRVYRVRRVEGEEVAGVPLVLGGGLIASLVITVVAGIIVQGFWRMVDRAD